jgi:hypothetical protein
MKTLAVYRDKETTFQHRTRIDFPLGVSRQTTPDDVHFAVHGSIDIFMVWPDYDDGSNEKVASINRYRQPTLIGTFKPEVISHFPNLPIPWSVIGMVCYQPTHQFDESRILCMELVPIHSFIDPADISKGSRLLRLGHILAEIAPPDKS